MFALGSKVFLRGARHGEPGIVIRIRPDRTTVIWPAPGDYIGTYPSNELILAGTLRGGKDDENVAT